MTYDVYFTQFVHADPTLVTVDPLDRSIACRRHAQFIAKQFADEGRICEHEFKNKGELFQRLVRHQELANVEYTSHSGQSSLPTGLETQEIYFIK